MENNNAGSAPGLDLAAKHSDGWPSEIYLNAGDDPLSHFSEYADVSWCDHPQGESDVRYVRANIPATTPACCSLVGSDEYALNVLESCANWLLTRAETSWAKEFSHGGLMRQYAGSLREIRAALTHRATTAAPGLIDAARVAVTTLADKKWADITSPELIALAKLRNALAAAPDTATAAADPQGDTASASTETPELHALLGRWLSARDYYHSEDSEQVQSAWNNFIAHLDSRQQQGDLTDLLPSTYYMDPPDGGDVSVREQFARMACDAARYRWLKECNGGSIGIVAWHRDEDKEMVLTERYADEAIDADRAAQAQPVAYAGTGKLELYKAQRDELIESINNAGQ